VTRATRLSTVIGSVLAEQSSSSLVVVVPSEMKLDAARIITNLAAMESSGVVADESGGSAMNDTTTTSSESKEEYYGRGPDTWCTILLRTVLPVLIHNIRCATTTTTTNIRNDTNGDGAVCAQCCWAIGNLAGDGQHARDDVRTNGAVSPLVHTLRHAIGMITTEEAYTGGCGRRRQWIDLARNAAWALSNLARGGDTSAMEFIGGGSQMNLLDTHDFIAILSHTPPPPTAEDASMNITSSTTDSTVTWDDILVETFWMLAFLTAREDDGVRVLLKSPSAPGLFQAIINHFHSATQILTTTTTTSTTTTTITPEKTNVAMRIIVPIIRIIGNIATSNTGLYVPNLLHTSSSSSSNHLTTFLARWMNVIAEATTTSSSDLSAIATEVAWAIGTLLCDAGIASHPSTTVACPILLPALARVLVAGVGRGGGSTGSGGGGVRLELKRECLAALWNTVSVPPPPPSSSSSNTNNGIGDGIHDNMGIDNNNHHHPEDTTAIRDEMLLKLYQTENLIQSLLNTVLSHDIDAMQPALSIIDAMHRRLGRYDAAFRWVFEEGDCLDVLEGVCERASAAVSYGSGQEWSSSTGGGAAIEWCAEVAANLIDDYYGDDDTYIDGDGDDGMAMDGNSFGNGLTVPSTMPHFSFGGGGESPAAPFGNSSIGATTPSLGRGRGRGSVIPAWMQQNP